MVLNYIVPKFKHEILNTKVYGENTASKENDKLILLPLHMSNVKLDQLVQIIKLYKSLIYRNQCNTFLLNVK